jgi:dextranase
VIELVPAKATFAPGEPIEIELRGAGEPATVALWQLDRLVAEVEVAGGAGWATFPPQPEGGYGVECRSARTAVDVLADPLSRARYGFVSDYRAGRDVGGVADNVRRLHLNAVQFYDWMYRHARLLPPTDEFVDALGRELSLDSVRRLAAAVTGAGSLPLGYAAVYAAGAEEWPEWEADGLYRADGTPWTLGDFLWNVDPTSTRWQAHFADDLRGAIDEVGFAGFHLDQYGAPKVALRADGTRVDLAVAFPELIDRLAAELPEARLIFNNVNDFPTWATASANQAAIYIEVWSPHDRLTDLGRLAEKAHLLAPEQSVILAAYLSVYAIGADEAAACAAQCLQLATAFSHGATVLLHGEERAVLTEAYYARHRELAAESEAATRRYYDFAVRYGDLLFDRHAVDVTTTRLGGVNEELKIDAPVSTSHESRAGALWARVIRLPGGLLVSLIDLSSQQDDLWDAPKRPATPLHGVRLSLERVSGEPRFLFACPDEQPALLAVESGFDGRYDSVELPPFSTWALVWIPDGDVG